MGKFITLGILFVSALLASPACHAEAVFTASGTNANGAISASVTFSVTGDVLTVVLTNTSERAAQAPMDLLSAVLFRTPIDVNLTPCVATAANCGQYAAFVNPNGVLPPNGTGSSVVQNGNTCVPPNPNCAGPDLGQEFAYKKDASGGGFGGNYGAANWGLSSSGLGNIFGVPDLFDTSGANLDNPLSPDGINYSILPTAGIASDANSKLYAEPLVQNSVVMQLQGATGLDASQISGVVFQYGTSTSEPRLYSGPPAVPEPATLLLMGSGMFALAGRAWRRR